MTKNKESTRYFSSQQEDETAHSLKGMRTANSGAGKWTKGDVINKDASLLIECKTVTSDKNSFSIKKEWIEKNKKEARENRLDNNCIAFNFGPNQPNYFVIDLKLMRFLVEKLAEESK